MEQEPNAKLLCTRCKIEKPVTDFQKCKRRASGYQVHCRQCQNSATKKYREDTDNAYWVHGEGKPYYLYTITNPLGEKYVGYTGARPNVRWARHKSQYRHGKIGMVKLYNSFETYGVDNHTFEVVKEIPDKILAMQEETILILKLREINKDLNTSISTFRIGQYNKDTGELIKEWESVREVGEHFNRNSMYFYGAVSAPHRRGISMGYLWKILPFKDGTFYDLKTKQFVKKID
jgi:hypothetical protein